MAKLLNIKIDGRVLQVEEGANILAACRACGIIIPTLCYLEGINEEAGCSLCMVEVKGAKNLLRACVTSVAEGMEIFTATERVHRARRINLELLLAGHPEDCFFCDRNQICELRRLAYDMDLKEELYPKSIGVGVPNDTTSFSLIRDPDKCILCRRCISVCDKIQSVHAIDTASRGKLSFVATFMDKGLGNAECVNCGQCLLVCPTGAIIEQGAIEAAWKALSDPQKFTVVEVAPAVRASLGEEFGMPAGSLVTGKIAAALRRLGFKRVFDTQFAADLTIMEEANELIRRIKEKGKLPLITSCSPAWIKFAEHFYPELIGNISTCKSPQQMSGAITKTYYAGKFKLNPRSITVVSVMPCTAKKFEARRPEMKSAFNYWQKKLKLKDEESFFDVDYVLTTRELARMIKEAGIDFVNLADEDFDAPMGVSTGAGVIFGSTGGVMEAALRTAVEALSGKELEKIDFEELRGLAGIKSAEIEINGQRVKVAAANSLSQARVLLEEVRLGKSPYLFIEIMSCPGGCLGGGGQPLPTDAAKRKARMQAIYAEDKNKLIRKSHKNPAVLELYQEFLHEPLGELSEELLHTHYQHRPYR